MWRTTPLVIRSRNGRDVISNDPFLLLKDVTSNELFLSFCFIISKEASNKIQNYFLQCPITNMKNKKGNTNFKTLSFLQKKVRLKKWNESANVLQWVLFFFPTRWVENLLQRKWSTRFKNSWVGNRSKWVFNRIRAECWNNVRHI